MGTQLELKRGPRVHEAPRWADALIVVSGAVVPVQHVHDHDVTTKKWTGIQGVLLGGLVFLALMYLPGMFYTKNMIKDQFWWWWGDPPVGGGFLEVIAARCSPSC